MATHATTTTLNRSEILRAAWASYREQDNFVARTSGKVFPFARKLFAQHLSRAWAAAKARVLDQARLAAEAALPPKVQAIRAELVAMEMSDAPVNWARHRELSIELARAA